MRYILLSALLTMVTCAMAQQAQFSSADFFSTTSGWIMDVETDNQGSTYAAGYFYGNLNLPGNTLSNADGSIGDGFVYKQDVNGNISWVKHLSGEGQITAIHRATDNSLFIAGVIRNTGVFNGTTYNTSGTMDAFIARLNTQGQTMWLKLLSGTTDGDYNSIGINDIVADGNNNIYFTGFFTDSVKYGTTTLHASGVNDIMTGKLSAGGNLQWMERAGGSYGGDCGLPNNDNGAGIALDNSDGLFITGHYAYNLQIGTSNFTAASTVDAYLAKYDRNGNFKWAVTMGGDSWDIATAVACDANNNVFVGGHFQQNITIGTSTYTSVSAWGSQYDIFLARFDGSGSLVWSKQEGSTLSEYVNRMATDYNGNLYIGGTMDGESKIADSTVTGLPERCFVAKYQKSGTPVYLAMGGSYDNFMRAFDLDRNNDIVMGGAVTVNPGTPAEFGTHTVNTTDNYIFTATLDDPFNSMFSVNENREKVRSAAYPNPATDHVTLSWTFDTEDTEVQIYDITGRLRLSQRTAGGMANIDVSKFAPGLYLYSIRSHDKILSGGKFVIE